MESREKRIYVGNLSKNIRASDLYDHFIKCGKISQIFYKEPPFAFVEFEEPDSAELAIRTLDLSVVNKRKIFVKEFFRKNKKSDKKVKKKVFNDEIEENESIDMQKFFTKQYGYCGHNSILNGNGSIHKCCMITIEKRDVLPYAEHLAKNLSNLGISNEIDYLDLNSSRDSILQRLFMDGYYFAIFVNDSNVKCQSFSVFTLRGMRIEHKNIPFDEGIKLIFKIYIQKNIQYSTEKMPENILNFIEQLIFNGNLTVTQYNVLISYLRHKRKEQRKLEVGNLDDLKATSEKFENSVYEELFKKVLNALDIVIDRWVWREIHSDSKKS
ncbi:unnamed protein product [Chironomus riparius]|uniref:RRM domain-containing protein n=1 Tax=Chironomus riparius TaxID=315576 RepID=A0A9N9S8E2_9DIPT|nr:unnamed protein product [Chironomus riparius]